MERMSPMDSMFLYVENQNSPMHVGSASIFRGPAPKYGDVVRMVLGKLDQVPRFRQKVRFVPFELGRPVWVDDPHFQILYHIRHAAVPAPGSDEALRNLSGRVLAQHLDRTKPLWELWMVEGLADDRWAFVSKVHHCMVDGVAGTDLLSVLLEPEGSRGGRRKVQWAPEREASGARLIADAFADSVTSPWTRLRGLPVARRLALPDRQELIGILRGTAVSLRRPKPTPRSLNGPVGPHRRWSWARSSLAEVKEIRSTVGGTVNDVILAVITRGFRDLLLGRGEPVEGKVVRTLVPVSVRSEAERGSLNNRVSGVFAELPVGVGDPLLRLEEIRKQMTGLKQSKQAQAGDILAGMSGFAPSMWLALSARLAARLPQWAMQTATTNVPGPQTPVFALGRQMLECHPYIPLAAHCRITIGIFSYAGGLTFGLTGDYDSVPDLDVLARGIEAGIAELVQAARTQAKQERPKPPPRTGRRPAPRRDAASQEGVPVGTP